MDATDGTANTSIATTSVISATMTAPIDAPRPSGVWSAIHPTSGSSAIASVIPTITHTGTGARSRMSTMRTTATTTIAVARPADRQSSRPHTVPGAGSRGTAVG